MPCSVACSVYNGPTAFCMSLRPRSCRRVLFLCDVQPLPGLPGGALRGVHDENARRLQPQPHLQGGMAGQNHPA